MLSNGGMNWTSHNVVLPEGLHEEVKRRSKGLKGGRLGLTKYLYAGASLWMAQQSDDVLVQLCRMVEELERMPTQDAAKIIQHLGQRQPIDQDEVQRIVKRGWELYGQVVRERGGRERAARRRKA